MIPVRVPAAATPPVVARGKFIAADHPLADMSLPAGLCPVCDGALADTSCTLVYVGALPEDRDGAWFTGAAVAVHDGCAMPEGDLFDD